MGSLDDHGNNICAIAIEGLDRIGVALTPKASDTPCYFRITSRSSSKKPAWHNA